MASEPRREHSYILDSFEEFEALARRALHKGDRRMDSASKSMNSLHTLKFCGFLFYCLNVFFIELFVLANVVFLLLFGQMTFVQMTFEEKGNVIHYCLGKCCLVRCRSAGYIAKFILTWRHVGLAGMSWNESVRSCSKGIGYLLHL